MPPADAEHAALITRVVVWLVANGHSADRVLATPGLRITESSSGRSPDILVLRRPAPRGAVWIDPIDTLLVVEVVSPGSENLDRMIKPGEYARAGITRFWRVERDGGPARHYGGQPGSDARSARTRRSSPPSRVTSPAPTVRTRSPGRTNAATRPAAADQDGS